MEQQRTFSIIQALKYGIKTLYDHFFLLIGAQLCCQAVSDGLFLCAFAMNPIFKEDYMWLKTKMSQDAAIGFFDLIKGIDLFYLFSNHTLFLIVTVPVYLALTSVLSWGRIQISIDIFDTGSSRFSRIFAWVSRGHKAFAVGLLFLLFFIGFKAGLEAFSKPLPYTMVTADSLFLVLLLLIVGGLSGLSKALPLVLYVLIAFYFYLRLLFVSESLVDKDSSVYNAFVRSWKITFGNVLYLSKLLALSLLVFLCFGLFIGLLKWFSLGFLSIHFQSFWEVIIPLVAEFLLIVIGQSFIYAYRQLSPADHT